MVIVESDESAAERVGVFLRAGRSGPSPTPEPVFVVTDPDAADGSELVIDALQDEPEARCRAYPELGKRLPGGTVYVASDPEEMERIEAFLADPTSLIGLSVFGPAVFRQLVEVVPSHRTGMQASRAAHRLVKLMGKVPVPVPVGRASVGTRLLNRLYETADTLLIEGAVPHELDEAMLAFGYDMGVYEAQDLIGLDVAYAARKRQADTRNPERRYVPISDRMVEEGRLGKKVGVGWYRYPGGGGAVIDPLVEDLVREEAWFAGIEPRPFTVATMQRRLLLGLIHEGALMLEDGTAPDARQIDRVAVAGLGFPSGMGGPMACADRLGLAAIRADLADLAQEDPVVWCVPGVIDDCLAGNCALSD